MILNSLYLTEDAWNSGMQHTSFYFYAHQVISTHMLSCGIHTCPSKCHQISDHSKMACEVSIFGVCAVGHPIQRKCKEPQSPCSKCEKERKAKERQAADDFAHALRLADLDDKIEQERETIQRVRDAEDKAKALSQKQGDLRVAIRRRCRLSCVEFNTTYKKPRKGQGNRLR